MAEGAAAAGVEGAEGFCWARNGPKRTAVRHKASANVIALVNKLIPPSRSDLKLRRKYSSGKVFLPTIPGGIPPGVHGSKIGQVHLFLGIRVEVC